MVCRTLSVGAVSSIATPVYIGGLSNSPQRLPSLRSLRRAGAIHPAPRCRRGRAIPHRYLGSFRPLAGCVSLHLPRTRKRPRRQRQHRAKHTCFRQKGVTCRATRGRRRFTSAYLCGGELQPTSLIHMIDPNEGVDQFGHATQAIGPERHH